MMLRELRVQVRIWIRCWRAALVACAFLGTLPNPLRAQALEGLDALVLALMRQYDVPGMALTVVRGDSVEVLRGFGLARVADSVPVDPERTVFRVASVAKLFVAAAAVTLAERAVLDLVENIQHYAPDLPLESRFTEPITLHHLLTHTAGFDERMIGYAATSRLAIRPLGAYLVENLPRRGWRPSEVTGYSNHGMAVAAYLVERATGIPFSEYARDSLFLRLGMQSTSYLDVVPALRGDQALGHLCDADSCTAADEVYSHPYPVGLAYSTAADMARFLIMQLNAGQIDGEPVLPAAVIDRMQAVHFTHDQSIPGMSYGFFNQTELGRRALTHAGSVPGVSNLFLIVPEAGVGFYFVANGGRSGFGAALKDSLLARLLDERQEVGADQPFSLSPEYITQFAGPYQLTRYAHYTVEKFPALFAMSVVLRATERGSLVMSVGERLEFAPLDSLRFREIGGERVFAFRRDHRGRVTHLFGAMPFFGADFPATFERRHWFDAARVKNEYVSYLLGSPLILLLFLWPVTAALAAWWGRRRNQTRRPAGKGSRVAIILALLFSVLFAWFGFGFIARSTRMLESTTGIVTGMTPGMRLLLQLPYALGLLAAFILGFAIAAWRRGYWGPARRTYYTLVAMMALLAVAFLVRWNYLPPVWR
jgi:CubicO group peptidase (beta-lactamase class C family)